jgi:glucose/arabinose dehydrogenase
MATNRIRSRILLVVLISTLAVAFPRLTFGDELSNTRSYSRHVKLDLKLISGGFNSPVFLVSPPEETERLFVVEQRGTIRILKRGIVLPEYFLDIRDRVSFYGERGLLSMAFHPRFADNHRLFAFYTNKRGHLVISEFLASASEPDRALEQSERRLLVIPHPPTWTHNGGQLGFGPDGYLYISTGDGAEQDDWWNNGQKRTTLLGKLLRVDVDGRDSGLAYRIPHSNPFSRTDAAAPEIWAYGLRNPWRFSFDRKTGDLYIADVGNSSWEEVNVELAHSAGGKNYGWRFMEGNHCFIPPQKCPTRGLTLPVHEYPTPAEEAVEGKGHWGIASSITGGYVYRGSRMPALRGTYFFADYFLGMVQTFRLRDGKASQLRDVTEQLTKQWPPGTPRFSSFGEDATGELYLLEHAKGEVYKIVPRANVP